MSFTLSSPPKPLFLLPYKYMLTLAPLQLNIHQRLHPPPDLLSCRLLAAPARAHRYPLPRRRLPARPALPLDSHPRHHHPLPHHAPQHRILPARHHRLLDQLDLPALLQVFPPRPREFSAFLLARRPLRVFCLRGILPRPRQALDLGLREAGI